MDPIVAIVGNTKTAADMSAVAEELGRELAKAGFRILVYSSDPAYLEAPVVRGYVASQAAKPRSVQVRYPLHGSKPAFPEQRTHGQVFDWIPDASVDWEMSFYQSLNEVDGLLLMGGGISTKVAGLVALGHRRAMLTLASFSGEAANVWGILRPGRDLVSADEITLMGAPEWSADSAARCVQALRDQLARGVQQARQRVLEESRREATVTQHAIAAMVLFCLGVFAVPIAATKDLGETWLVWLLFISPLLAGVAGSTIRLVFDLRQGVAPLSRQSTVTTAALGLVAGGVAGLLFITAQTAITDTATMSKQAGRLVPFGVAVGFIAGLTLDAVFRKLIAADVVELSAVEAKKRA